MKSIPTARGSVRTTRTRHRPALSRVAMAALLGLGATTAQAFEVETGNPDLKVLWDTTVKYSTGFRLKNPSPAIVEGANYDPASPGYFPNTDDGSRNFKRGLVSSRLDLLSELDVAYQNVGFRVSAAGWYDSVYQSRNDNNSPATANPISVGSNQFTDATRRLHGGDAEILDAFVFGKFKLGSMPAMGRLGKHTLVYGESLMLGANGIAAAQASIDVVKAATVPNAQFKEFMMPINQLSGQVQVTPGVMLGGYYMLDSMSDRLPGSGSYYSFMDALADGGERLIVGSSPAGNVSFHRQADMKAKKSGQFGTQLRFSHADVDYGLYAVQWNDHGPSGLYLHPSSGAPSVTASGVQIGTYQFVYHEGIRALGGSFSTTLGNVNVSGEASFRSNTPLDSDAQLDLAGANNSSNPLYAVGKSAHAQVNWIASLGPSFLAREADFVGEIAWNRLLSVTKNRAALNPNATRDATNIRVIFEPKYRQVMSGVDLSVPVGLGYGISGNSSVVGAFLGKGIGDISVGLNGSYLDVWRFGLNLTHYFGKAGAFIEAGHRTFKQSYADRTYLSLNVRRTF